MRKIISLLLALCLVVGMVPLAARAEGNDWPAPDESRFTDIHLKYFDARNQEEHWNRQSGNSYPFVTAWTEQYQPNKNTAPTEDLGMLPGKQGFKYGAIFEFKSFTYGNQSYYKGTIPALEDNKPYEIGKGENVVIELPIGGNAAPSFELTIEGSFSLQGNLSFEYHPFVTSNEGATVANIVFEKPVSVGENGNLSLTGPWRFTSADTLIPKPTFTFGENGKIEVTEGGTITVDSTAAVTVPETATKTPIVVNGGVVNLNKYGSGATTRNPSLTTSSVPIIELQNGEINSNGDVTVSATGEHPAVKVVGGTLKLNAGTYSSVSGEAIEVGDNGLVEIPKESTAKVTTTAENGKAIKLTSGAKVKLGDTTVTSGEQEGYVDNNGIAHFAPGATSGEETTPMNAAVLLSDGTLIEGSETQAPTVTTDETGATTVTVPAGGAVTQSNEDRVVYTNGGTVNQTEEGTIATPTEPQPEQPTPPVTPTTPTYTNTISDTDNGKVTVSPTSPKKDDTVTITTTPNEGYKVGSVAVTDADGKTVTVTNAGNGKYTFKQPGSKVTIKVTFVWDNPFTDVGTAWYTNAIQYVYENGLMAGTGDTTFDPEMNLTRAMTAQILYNLEGKPEVSADATFADMNVAPTWSVDAIAWAQDTGVVAGIGNNKFDPNANVTREQFAQMMYNYAKYKEYDLTKTGDLSKFPDEANISSWAETALSWANGNGLINGHDDGTLDPQGNTIRGQAASILMNFDLNLVK